MIANDFHTDGFSIDELLFAWRWFLEPPGAPPLVPPLVLVLDDKQVVLALRPGAPSATFQLDPADFPYAGPWSLGRLRRGIGARASLAIEEKVLEQILEAADRARDAAGGGGDLSIEGLAIARALKAEVGRGVILDPDPISALPLPPHAALQQTLDMLLPDDRSAGLFLYGRGGVEASFIVEKRDGRAQRLCSHRELELSAGPLRDFRDGAHREVLDRMARRIAPPHVALFATLDGWREIVGPAPGALASQVAQRRALIDPAPPWVVALTGAAAVAGVAMGASKLFGRFVPQTIKDTARAMNPLATPFAALGFDPIALFGELRRLY